MSIDLHGDLANYIDLDELLDRLKLRHMDRVGYTDRDMEILVSYLGDRSLWEILTPITDRLLETGELEDIKEIIKMGGSF